MSLLSLNPFLLSGQQRIEGVLETFLPVTPNTPHSLQDAMRYSVLDGGKRVRPLLVYSAGKLFDVPSSTLDIPAAAIELIHVYSLIHDDLPAMDDDELRRGRATSHIAFDEATAILAGDALQAMAFNILSNDPRLDISAEARLQLITTLSDASGSFGMVGGQAIDLFYTDNGKDLSEVELENMHLHKTGALIRASVRMACLCSPTITEEQVHALDAYAKSVGLAFQVRDDILDIEGDTETLGKTQGADIAANKSTYPAILGLEEARQKADNLYQAAMQSLDVFDHKADDLRSIANFIVNRHK